MNREQISALMDGELDDAPAQALCAQFKSDESTGCWATYHLIGDVLRNEGPVHRDFALRFAERLAAEPTVLAPGVRSIAEERSAPGWQSALRARPWYYGMAAAASVAAVSLVGWFGMQEFSIGTGAGELAAARSVRNVVAVSADPSALGPSGRRSQGLGMNPYLLVHQEYSPTTAMQGVRPYVRTVADMAAPE